MSFAAIIAPAGSVPRASRHLQPVEFFFDAMKGVVADVSAGTHRQHSTARRFEGATPQQGVGTCLAGIALTPLHVRSETGAEFAAHGLGRRGAVAVECRQRSLQHPRPCRAGLLADRIAIVQVAVTATAA